MTKGSQWRDRKGGKKYHLQALAQSLLGNAQGGLADGALEPGGGFPFHWMSSGSINLPIWGVSNNAETKGFGIVILQLQWMELHAAFWPKKTEETENSTAGQHYGPHQDEADSLVWTWMMNEDWGNTKIAPSLSPFESNHSMFHSESIVVV